MVVCRLSTVEVVLVDEFLLALHAILVHLLQELHAQFDILDEGLASASGEVLPHDDTQHLEILRLRSHCVCRHNPAANPQLMCQGELVIRPLSFSIWRQAECHQRKSIARLLGHYDKSERLKGVGKIVGRESKISHDLGVPLLAQTLPDVNHLLRSLD